jgi:NAD(P)-dependent dehydrogenase (short-subunit alcohol dehydrogenase family)
MGALAGKVAIVTGGTSGIGEGIAALFVEEGAKVVVAARRQDEGAALEKRLGVRFVRTDVANEADVKAMIDQTVTWFGRVDCLVNNAALPALFRDHALGTRLGEGTSTPAVRFYSIDMN